ncbi:hypothetical protein AOLI_G00196710 [Acnodon oligacanthus]
MDVQCATTKAQRLIRISTVGKLDYNVFLKADVLPNQSKTSVHSAWVFATSADVVKDTGRPVAMLLPSYGRSVVLKNGFAFVDTAIICLPPAKEHTVILVLVDCFSKAGKFMPLPKLSSAKETVELFFSTWSGFTGRENDVCGSLSASSWELLRVCPLASTQKPTTRLRASIKTLPRLCGA